MDFRVFVDSILLCLINYYKDGDECKGIVYFLFRSDR